MFRLDCKGLACPEPVMRTTQAISERPDEEIEVVVDNPAAATNVARLLEAKGYGVETREEEGQWVVLGRPGEGQGCTTCEVAAGGGGGRTLVMITAQTLGRGDEELGKGLMLNFLKTLPEMEGLWRIVLVNGGVKLAVEGAETLEQLKRLEAQGVSILVCGTCLNHYGLLERKQVGETTNMLDIVTSLELAEKVINI